MYRKLAFELDLPMQQKIHLVISITYLESVLRNPDLYKKKKPDYSGLILVEGDTEEWQSYEIEKIIDKRQIKYSKSKPVTKYQIK